MRDFRKQLFAILTWMLPAIVSVSATAPALAENQRSKTIECPKSEIRDALRGSADDLAFAIGDAAGLHVVFVNGAGSITLSDSPCFPDKNSGDLMAITTAGDYGNEMGLKELAGMDAFSLAPWTDVVELENKNFKIDGEPALATAATAKSTNDVPIFAAAVARRFKDGQYGLVKVFAKEDRKAEATIIAERLARGLQLKKTVAEQRAELGKSLSTAITRFVSDNRFSEAIDLCLTTESSAAEIKTRALALGWIDSGQVKQGELIMTALSAVDDAPGLLTVGMTDVDNLNGQNVSVIGCVVIAAAPLKPRLVSALSARGLGFYEQKLLLLSQGKVRDATRQELNPPTFSKDERGILMTSSEAPESELVPLGEVAISFGVFRRLD